MQVVHTQQDLQQALGVSASIGFVPTMGNLHSGHISLVKIAQQHAEKVVVSIFVNPTQFGVGEDFDAYPRTLEKDIELLAAAGVDCLFAPSIAEMYPEGLVSDFAFDVGAIGTIFCGASRPGHFNGVALVVSKLFNLVKPQIAVFGEKDFQQLKVIQQLTQRLCFPIQIISGRTERAADGLALSSRNQYLSEEERTVAPHLYITMQQAAEDIQRQKVIKAKFLNSLCDHALWRLVDLGFEPDYLTAVDASNLSDVNESTKSIVILAAARLGKTRLIDNLVVTNFAEFKQPDFIKS
ncbi:MAG: pantoate--beta-alanine ligase [Pseudomonadota bacterium]